MSHKGMSNLIKKDIISGLYHKMLEKSWEMWENLKENTSYEKSFKKFINLTFSDVITKSFRTSSDHAK